MRNYQLHPSQFCVGKAYKVSSKNFLWHQVESKRKKKRNKREKKLVWENFRDDAFWGILAKKKKKPLQCSKCLTVELTTFYISDTSFALLDIKISTEGNGLCSSVYYKPTDSRSYLLYSSSHPSLAKDYISFSQFLRLRLCSDDSDFSEKSEAMSQLATLFLSFKWATTVPNKLIDSQHYKRLRWKTLIAFYSLSHFTLATMQLNLSFLKTFNYSTTIQRLVLPFRNLHKFHSNVKKT